MEQEKIFVLLPPEAQELLADNEIDLVHELRRRGLDVERGYEADPAAGGEGQARDVVLVIIATAALVTAVSAGIVRVLDAVGRNKRFVTEDVTLAAVEGPDGQIVRDAAGNPIPYWRRTQRLLEPAETARSQSTEISTVGLRISVQDATAPQKTE